jgi:hypothetical protein
MITPQCLADGVSAEPDLIPATTMLAECSNRCHSKRIGPIIPGCVIAHVEQLLIRDGWMYEGSNHAVALFNPATNGLFRPDVHTDVYPYATAAYQLMVYNTDDILDGAADPPQALEVSRHLVEMDGGGDQRSEDNIGVGMPAIPADLGCPAGLSGAMALLAAEGDNVCMQKLLALDPATPLASTGRVFALVLELSTLWPQCAQAMRLMGMGAVLANVARMHPVHRLRVATILLGRYLAIMQATKYLQLARYMAVNDNWKDI